MVEYFRLTLISFGLLISISLFLYFFFSRPTYRAFFINPIYYLNTKDRVIALTFDDGPNATTTPKLLDVLNKYNIKATFFLQGSNIEKNRSLAQRIVTEGHAIGNHSYSHQRLIFKTPSFIHSEISKTDDLIVSIGAIKPIYFRPPFGAKLVVLPLVLNQMKKRLVTWTYCPQSQYDQEFSGDLVANQVIENLHPGVIILLHDGRSDNSDELVKAVEKIIIKSIIDQGYKFVTIDN